MSENLMMSDPGYLRVALDETKDGRLSPKQLKALLGYYNVPGLGLFVWDHDKQEWIPLTAEMLDGATKDGETV